jgi:TPR repeat protein
MIDRTETPGSKTRVLRDRDTGIALSSSRQLLATRPPGARARTSRGLAERLVNVKPREWLGFAAGLALAFACVALLAMGNLLPVGPRTAMPAGEATMAAARADGMLRTLLATGDTSPRGRKASDVDLAAALTLADRHLHGAEAARDQAEAAFWLRHALSLPLDQTTMRWALTQLGTVYAAPDAGKPEFAKARLLWEVAGGLGDPVAFCFNAALYEYGLGAERHRDLAHALYQKARAAGGCAGLEAALARTR